MTLSIVIIFGVLIVLPVLIIYLRYRKPENKVSETSITELSYKAYYDGLTGLFNRNQLENSLASWISSASQNQNKFTLFFIDLDNFKQINDSLGHDMGDQLLKIIGERLKNNIRKIDMAARLGGDEFILVLNGVSTPEIASAFAEKIRAILMKPAQIKKHEFIITASIGISFYPDNGTDSESLIKSADLALYKAKANGRNNYQFCTAEMNAEVKEKVSFKQALQDAFNHHEFHLVYLPRINIKSQEITGFEALLRWKNEKYGEVPPNKIIPLADEMGIVSQLSEWIMKTAIEQANQWDSYAISEPIRISINISSRHYTHENFLNNTLEILDKIHFPHNYLQLEINENLIMRDPEYSLKMIRELKRNGIQIIIDNFGTGYSSLNYLNQFGVDYIKIDRQFTKSTDTSDKQVLFVAAIADLARNLNIKILGEGVESKEQMELLARIGCDEVQGFYISRPLDEDQIPAFLEKYTSEKIIY
jgi:diguanylate cyclase (GGDEF)-like protein